MYKYFIDKPKVVNLIMIFFMAGLIALLTTATTVAELFPSAYGFGGDNLFIIPMILAIAWVLVFATVITLVLIPSMYVLQI